MIKVWLDRRDPKGLKARRELWGLKAQRVRRDLLAPRDQQVNHSPQVIPVPLIPRYNLARATKSKAK